MPSGTAHWQESMKVSRGCMGGEKVRLWTWTQILALLLVNSVTLDLYLMSLTSKMGIIKYTSSDCK